MANLAYMRIVPGFVVQRYNDDCSCAHQEFIPKGNVEWENERGTKIAEPAVSLIPIVLQQPGFRVEGYIDTVQGCDANCHIEFEYGIHIAFGGGEPEKVSVTFRFIYPNAETGNVEYKVAWEVWLNVLEETINKRRKIHAIKALRAAALGMGLKEAKSIVDAAEAIAVKIENSVKTFPREPSKVKRIGLCQKCDHRITKPGEMITLQDGTKIRSQELVGCKFTAFFKNGENCPLTMEDQVRMFRNDAHKHCTA